MVLPARRMAPASAPGYTLPGPDAKVLEIIKYAENAGISKPQIARGAQLSLGVVTKSVQILIARNLIKEFVHVTNKRSKHYIGVEFKPSTESGGGHWHSDGKIDVDYTSAVREFCLHQIAKMGIASVEELSVVNSNKRVFPQLTVVMIDEIVQAMVLDGELEEKIHMNRLCYRRKAAKKAERGGLLTSLPCGVCPRINECTPDGAFISPSTCVYMTAWFDF